MPIELNAATEATVAPIRESLRAAEKIRALRYPDAEATPPSSVLPALATRQGKILGFDDDGAPVAREMVIDNITLGSDATGDVYYRDAGGDLTRLPIGTTGQGLVVAGGIPSWSAVASTIANLGLGTGATGDIYYRNSSGVMVKLAIGTTGQGLVVAGGLPSWAGLSIANLGLGTGAAGDIYQRNGSGALVRIAKGTAGQVLGIDEFEAVKWIDAATVEDRYFYQEGITSDATPVRFNFDGITTVTAGNTLVLNNYQLIRYRGTIVASTEAGVCFTQEFTGGLKRVANAASTALVGTVSYDARADSGASAWDAVISADTTRGGLALTVTGAAATTIRWKAQIDVLAREIWNPFW